MRSRLTRASAAAYVENQGPHIQMAPTSNGDRGVPCVLPSADQETAMRIHDEKKNNGEASHAVHDADTDPRKP